MMQATCDCGLVSIEVPGPPAYLNECQCSICRRYGVRWGYWRGDEVRLVGETDAYVRDGGTLEFHRCKRCGCVTHWHPPEQGSARIGVNGRLLEPAALSGVPIRVTEGPPE